MKAFQRILTVFLVLTLNFFLPRLMPGDPLSYLDNESPGSDSPLLVTEATRQKLLAYYGLDRPLGEQYVDYLRGLARGDLGWSIYYNAPVTGVLLGRMRWTLLLMGASTAIYVALGVALGVISAWRRGSALDGGLLVGTLALGSAPSFFVAMLLLIVFAIRWRVFPIGGASTPALFHARGVARVADVAAHMALPVTALVLTHTWGVYLTTRNAMLGALGEDYARTAFAKGLRERAVVVRHVLPNALLPVVTEIALRLGATIMGAMFVEVVFAYPGMGAMIREACLARDYPLLQGAFLATMAFIMLFNLAADLLYSRLDPRLRAT